MNCQTKFLFGAVCTQCLVLKIIELLFIGVVFEQNGSWQIFQADCPMHAVIKHSHLSRFYPPSDIIKMVPSTCIQVDFETSGNIIKVKK